MTSVFRFVAADMLGQAKEPLSIGFIKQKGWVESLDNFEFHFAPIYFAACHSEECLSKEFVADDKKFVDLVITTADKRADRRLLVMQNGLDAVLELKKFKRIYQCPDWKVCGPPAWNLLCKFDLNITGRCLISSCDSFVVLLV